MLNYLYNRFLSRKQKNNLKKIYYKTNKIITDLFFRYDGEQLLKMLTSMGIKKGDTILVHSSFDPFNGFQENPQQIIKLLLELIGIEGNLLMVSMPYTCSASDYLKKNIVFNVRKTPSKMGIISEIFRRRKDVLRSLHPTHPVLALGKDAEWLVEGHENCFFPCGQGTPFDKLRSLKGKILFFDAPFNSFTFIHYLEDLFKDSFSFPLYTDTPFKIKIIDSNGNELYMKTYVFSPMAVSARRPEVLEKNLLNRKSILKKRIGKTKLMLITAEDAVSCANMMIENKISLY